MKPSIAVDYDGTWASQPKFFAKFGKALRKAGCTVTVLTGNNDAEAVLKDDGYHKSFDAVVVVKSTDPLDVAAEKADWLKTHKADLLIDNNVANVTAASAVTNAALFVPQQPKPEKKSIDLAAEVRALRTI